MNDDHGESECGTYFFHWVSAGDSPGGEWVEYEWPSTVTVARIEFDTQYYSDLTCNDGNTGRTLAGGTVQYWAGSWVTAGTVSGKSGDWSFTFPSPVQTTRIRLYDLYASTLGNQDSNPVIYEWRVYECN
jgi:hypothetical protein